MRRRYLNLSETEMRFNFSSLLDIGRVADKYARVEYKDREGKTRPTLPHCHA